MVPATLLRPAVPAVVIATTLFTVPLAPARAQTSIIDEIVVTAQRREEQLQEVPLAVTAFSGDQLEVLQVEQALDMGRLVPNLIAHNNTGLGTANAYSLRALNNTESIPTFDPPVGSYVDDIYVARQNANNFTLFDVDRIEVLRGPQGTLFGRNTTGGAVRVILREPAAERGGYLELGAGDYDRLSARGSIDVPLSDTFLTKFSAFWIDQDGFVDNLTTGAEYNAEENLGLRAAFLWQVLEDVSWHFAADYENTEDPNIANFKQGSARITHTGLPDSGTPLASFFTGHKSTFAFGNDVESRNYTSDVEWDSPIGTVNFITGWRKMDQEFAMDFLDGNFALRSAFGQVPPAWGGFTITNDAEYEQLTQEIKLAANLGDRLEYVAGFFYLDEDNFTDFGDIFDFDLGLAAPPFQPIGSIIPLVLADRILENDVESWAVYLQGDYALTDQWTLTLGVRYTDEEKDISYTDNQPLADCRPAPGCPFTDVNGDGIDDNDLRNENFARLGIPREQSEELWTPRIALQYAVSDELNFYASATRGFKSGGWNARGTTPDQLQPFESEVAWSYEVGMHSEWFDNTLRLNLTAFWLDVSDFQLPTAFQTESGQVQFITRNFADLEDKGIEVELIATPLEGLTLLANLGLQDGEYRNLAPEIAAQQQACRDALAGGLPTRNLCSAGIIDPSGNIAEPTRVPDYTATLGVIYTIPVLDTFELTPSAYLYSLGDHVVFSTGEPAFSVDGYTTYNASLELRQVQQDWSVVLECRNCNDRTMLVSGLAGVPYYQDPRTWQVRFRKNFGS